MSVTPETSQSERFALKLNPPAALENILFMSVTRVKSGVSVVLYTILDALVNIPFMDVHSMLPHCLISSSLSALKPRLLICMPVRPPYMETT